MLRSWLGFGASATVSSPSTTSRCGGGPARAPAEASSEIPVAAICATTEPNRASQFDRDFRPSPVTRCRWLRVFQAEQRGTPLPPVSVVRVGDGYALRDGHHRVSVARARGAATIRAVVEAS